jgi:hypothetical protein
VTVGVEDFGIPIVLEFNDRRWRRATLPALPPQSRLDAVDGRWAVGVTTGTLSPEIPLVLERRSGVWERATVPELEWSSLETVAVVAPDDVWAFGRLDITQGEPEPNFVWSILHFDGDVWSAVSNPSAPSLDIGDPTDAVAVGRTDEVWAVGQLYHSDELHVFLRSLHGC